MLTRRPARNGAGSKDALPSERPRGTRVSRWRKRVAAALAQAPTAYTILSTVGILLAGWWTWHVYLQERRGLPRGVADLRVIDVALTDKDVWLLRAQIEVANVGYAKLGVHAIRTQVMQVLPLPACATDTVISEEIEGAQADCVGSQIASAVWAQRLCDEHFNWPLRQERYVPFDPVYTVDPQGKTVFDHEFVIGPGVGYVLVAATIYLAPLGKAETERPALAGSPAKPGVAMQTDAPDPPPTRAPRPITQIPDPNRPGQAHCLRDSDPQAQIARGTAMSSEGLPAALVRYVPHKLGSTR